MCVIVICKEKLPSREQINRMAIANSDGFGVGWYESGMIRFYKDVCKPNDVASAIYRLHVSAPCVLHFRLATHGEAVKELAHPFIVSPTLENPVKGRTKDSLLFHNGVCLNAELVFMAYWAGRGERIPDKAFPYSDTRLVAFLVSVLGENVLSLLDGKFALMTANGIRTFGEFFKHEDLMVSNHYWQATYGYSYYKGQQTKSVVQIQRMITGPFQGGNKDEF